MPKKICLFTAHSPTTGGGAVILRSLIKNIPELDFQWKYLSEKPSVNYENGYMGQGIMGSSLFSDITRTWQMLAGKKVKRIDEIINQLLEMDCDAYWIVSHNEGLRIAVELKKVQKDRPVHLTIHDDWAGAISTRSVRYRLMSGLARKMTVKALKSVDSVDLISKGMQSYYHHLSNRNGEICHRYLPKDSLNEPACVNISSLEEINVGHIGSVYDTGDFIQFLKLLHDFGKLKNIKVIINMWGYHPKEGEMPQEYSGILKIHGDLPENLAIDALSKCNFVYAMYPLSKKFAIFSQTSLPTKLSSYVQACRPIFGHTPYESTLAEFINETSIGVTWSDSKIAYGIAIIEKILLLDLHPELWNKARCNYFGEGNLEVIKNSFD